jgi:hypothetical protein
MPLSQALGYGVMVNETSLPPLLKSSSTMVGVLIAEGCGFQPSGFITERECFAT